MNEKIKNKFTLLLMMIVVSSGLTMSAQDVVKGVVLSDSDESAVMGASVRVDGTSFGTITDLDGNFSLKIPNDKNVLVVSYLGYKEQKVSLNKNQNFYTIRMREDVELLDEVVVVGYGTMRKKELTGAVARVESESLTKISTSDLGTALQGQIAGVSVQSSSGAPGSAANIQIRGINSISGSNTPLFIVDGIPQSGDPGLSSSEIESIDVLKDAASAAIYGTRGAGGVILITTKEGKTDQMRVTLDGYYGVQKITSGLELMNAQQYIYQRLLTNRYVNYKDDSNFWTPLDNSPINFTNDSNLMKVIQNDNAAIQNYSLTVSGGRKDLTYNIVANYFDQDGVIINSSFNRYNVRANTSFKKQKWTINTSLGFKVEERESPGWGLLTESYKYDPTQSPIDPNTSISTAGGSVTDQQNFGNIMARIKEQNTSETEGFSGNLQIYYNVLKDLRLSTRLGGAYGSQKNTMLKPLFKIYNQDGELVENPQTRSELKNTHIKNSSLAWESGIDWNKKIAKHLIKLTGIFSLEQYKYSSFFGGVKDLVSNDVPVLNGGTADMTSGSGTGQWQQDRISSLIGMMGRAQYNYADKYMLSASVRYDGSSRFASKNRWGVFPSVSAGWNISEEKFWKPMKSYFNQFKLRGSYGMTGNQNFADYAFSSIIELHQDYAFGTESKDKISLGGIQKSYANANVRWETTRQLNIGVDLAFFDNSLTFSADVYKSDKKDMLFPLLLPISVGAGQGSTVTLNVGDMVNKGVELSIGYRNRIGKLDYYANFIYSKNENEITRMSEFTKVSYFKDGTAVDGVTNSDRVTAIREGYEAGAFFVMETKGIINTEEKLAEYQRFMPNAQMGDLMYIDQNNDGLLDDNDRIYGGSGMPEHELGLNLGGSYRGFDLSMQWFASLGNEIINGTKIYTYMYTTSRDLVYQWTPENPYSPIPINRGRDHYNYRGYADRWVEDGSFVRLKNVVLGYTFPKQWLSVCKSNKFRLYVAADNLVTLTKYQGYDPEVGNNGLSTRGLDKGNYPVSLQIRGGFQLEF